MTAKSKTTNKTKAERLKENQAKARAARPHLKPLVFDYKKVEHLAGLGLSQRKIALALGCSERTVGQRLHDDAEFAAAYARGRVSREQIVASKLQERIADGDTSAIKFYLACQCDWKESSKVEAEVKADVSVEHDLTAMSLAELMVLAGECED